MSCCAWYEQGINRRSKGSLIIGLLCKRYPIWSSDFSSESRPPSAITHDRVINQVNVLTSRFSSLPSSLASLAVSTILNNPKFLLTFMAVNRKRLAAQYTLCTDFFRHHSIPYIPSNAGIFIWVDLRNYLEYQSEHTALEKERGLSRKFMNGGLHLASSESFFGETFGWFRITFSLETNILQVGLNRYSFLVD